MGNRFKAIRVTFFVFSLGAKMRAYAIRIMRLSQIMQKKRKKEKESETTVTDYEGGKKKRANQR